LDAASNNSVEDIRNLIDQVRIPPQVGKYSIYIIDEVHMLSNQAFNAFLKTLEEPPLHAFFILATTEKHKIIPTILSRCQIFDFRRIKPEDITQYLEYISKNEGVDYEVDALDIIANKSDGGLRDALSIYDQIISFSGRNITYKMVIDNLNVLDYEYYFSIVDAFNENSITKALILFDEIIDKGFDGHNFINGLASHLRNILVCKDEATLRLLETSAGIKDRYKVQAENCSTFFLFESLNLCSQCDIQYKLSKNQRLHVELTLIQICNIITEKKKLSLNQKEAENNPEKIPLQMDNPEKINSLPPIKKPVTNDAKIPANEFPSFSIKDALKVKPVKTSVTSITEKKTFSEDENKESKNHETSNFTQQELITAWEKYSYLCKDEQPRMYNTLSTQIPVLKENFEIELLLNNLLQEEEVNRIKPSLLDFLCNELKNKKIVLTTRLAQPDELNKKLYTNKEKFDHLAQKNPGLISFKQQLGLELE
jgi:DNA polymerase-3 subunit gamma/tau